MISGDLVSIVHPGGLFGPINTPMILGIVVEPPNEVSVVKVFWFCDKSFELPTYIHVEEIEVYRAK